MQHDKIRKLQLELKSNLKCIYLGYNLQTRQENESVFAVRNAGLLQCRYVFYLVYLESSKMGTNQEINANVFTFSKEKSSKYIFFC